MVLLAFVTAAAADPGDVSPDGIFTEVDPELLVEPASPLPSAFRAYNVDLTALAAVLATAPMEVLPPRPPDSPTFIHPPMPGGGFAEVAVHNSPILGADLASQLPQIQTYVFRGRRDGLISGRLYQDGNGMQALMGTGDGLVRLHPMETQNGIFYITYFERDRTDGANDFTHSPDEQENPRIPQVPGSAPVSLAPDSLQPLAGIETGPTLTVYRLAMVSTGDYTQARDTIEDDGFDDVIGSMVAEVNNLNAFLESEVSVRLDFVAVWLYDDPETDPFDGDCDVGGDDVCVGGPDDGQACNADSECRPTACTLRDALPNVLDNVIGPANYDIGFGFGTGGGNGCAWYVICDPDKGRGAAQVNVANPAGTAATGVMAHEGGHQLHARHTFSGQEGGCTQIEFNSQSAYEPGSGSTVMSYRGSCADPDDETKNDNVETSGYPAGFYYSSRSFEEIADNTANGTGANCGSTFATGNSAPIVNAGPDFTIPKSTPFMLTGSGIDPNGDDLTFTWEQHDKADTRRNIDTDPDGEGPIIRSVRPRSAPTRIVPRLEELLSGTSKRGEILPFKERELTFRLTARDNRMAGGGVAYDSMVITVEGEPFFVISPNGGEVVGTDCTEPVTWEKGGSVSNEVSVSLSDDGGETFSTNLLFGTANDESTNVTYPCDATTDARIRISGDDNIFFDVSDAEFTIEQNEPVSQLQAAGGSVDDLCEFTIAFESESEDDCSLGQNNVVANATLLTGNATLGPENFQTVPDGTKKVDGSGSVLVSDLTSCPATVGLEIVATDGCGDSNIESMEVDVVDDTPPVLVNTPADMVVECDAIPEPANVTAMDNCDDDPNLEFGEAEIPGDCPGNFTLERLWEATDECNGTVEHLQTITVQDTTPPDVVTSEDDLYCVWPANHRYICFGQLDFAPMITDNCSEPITWVFDDCASDQPDDGPSGGWNGDGNTQADCIVAADKLSFCVRAERAGTGPGPGPGDAQDGRRYGVEIVATDACGNSSEPMKIGNILVPHDRREQRDCLRVTGQP